MFTGIITAVGSVREVRKGDAGDARLLIGAPAPEWDCRSIAIGSSIACSGVCLTLVGAEEGAFSVDASLETMAATTVGTWREGDGVNLERALAMGDELGGHMVSGHVDGMGEVLSVDRDGDGRRMVVEAPPGLERLLAPKGSVAVDGVSLTVNKVEGGRFGVMVIPHTWEHTTLRRLGAGDKINLEADMLARYVSRIVSPAARPPGG